MSNKLYHSFFLKILEPLTDKSNLPVLIHCKHGKDRTGVAIGKYEFAKID